MRSIGHRVLNPVNPIGVFQRKDGVNECFSWKFGRLTRISSCPFHSWQHWGSGVARSVLGTLKAFDENGNLKDEAQQTSILQLGSNLATVTAKLPT